MRVTRFFGTPRRSRILISIAIGILPLVLLAGANLWRQVQEGEQRVEQDRVALARAAALTVSGFVDTSLATLKTLTASSTLANPTPRAELTDMLNRARATDSPLAVLGLFRADGWDVALAGLDQPPLTLNVLDRQYVQEARSSGQPIVSPATIPRATGILTVDLVVPVDFVTGERGTLLGSLALTRLGDQLRGVAGSDTVQIVLVDADGQVILHPDPNVVRSVTSLKDRPEVQAALDGEIGSDRTTSSDGSETLTAFAPVPNYGWGVLVVQPTTTAFAPVRRDALLSSALLASVLALIGLVGWILGGRLQLAYTQVVQAKTQAEGAHAEAVAAQLRLAFLAEASRILGSSLEDETTLLRVAQHALGALGDWCAIDLVDDRDRDRTVASTDAAQAPDRHHLLQRVSRRLSEEAVATRHVTKSEASADADVSGFAVPLLAADRVLGSICCLRMGHQDYDEPELSLGTELARRVALAVDNVRLYRAAQRAIKDRDEFLSVAAHELKTPITSLRGYAQLVLRRLGTGQMHATGDVRKPLEVIELQSTKLNTLVAQLLDTSRLEAGKLTLTREPVDLVPVVQSLVERTRMISDQHRVFLTAPDSVIARVDQLRIEQVLTNLLDNAIKYSPHGGSVQVELRKQDRNCVRLSIQDQGIGIPPERRNHIFERFYQAHSEVLPAMAGMGLGLYISREIVELHGGTIHADFPPEGGARFVIALPTDG